MRLLNKHTGEEFTATINPAPRNTVYAGKYIAYKGVLAEGIENITDYDENGVERIPEPPQYQIEEEIILDLGEISASPI